MREESDQGIENLGEISENHALKKFEEVGQALHKDTPSLDTFGKMVLTLWCFSSRHLVPGRRLCSGHVDRAKQCRVNDICVWIRDVLGRRMCR